ncbi:hypothetical protein [Subtercola sp. YIM 133946]|uniref:hypothetical protein n=1 Tax=Subtercola sp. YIM 133946 TaxID=3118909 RepID=UPI002F9484BC
MAPRHVPQVVVPVPFDEVGDFVRHALKGTSLVDPLALLATGWTLFEPHLRFTAVDDQHTRIELDVVGRVPGAETLLFTRRVGEIDRFFVALQDELDSRSHGRSQTSARAPVETSTERLEASTERLEAPTERLEGID